MASTCTAGDPGPQGESFTIPHTPPLKHCRKPAVISLDGQGTVAKVTSSIRGQSKKPIVVRVVSAAQYTGTAVTGVDVIVILELDGLFSCVVVM